MLSTNNPRRKKAMFDFLVLAARAVAFLICCAVAVAAMLQYFDVLVK
jgi:hypothetical protein